MEIVEVLNSPQLNQFLDLPTKIYDLNRDRYIVPLRMHMKMMMGKLGRPEKHFFLAYKNGEPVARLGVKVHVHGGKKTLNFGFFECREGHVDAAQALIQKAHSLYPELKMMGPFHFRMEDPYIGVLVDGYDRDPYFLMPYNPPFYDDYLKQAGLSLAIDLFTYEVTDPNSLSEVVVRNAQRAKSAGVSIRTLDSKNLKSEARTIARIFNDALSQNWGFEEFLDEQVKEMVTLFRLFIDPRIVALAQKDGKDVGCLIMLPNYNPIIRECQGRISPALVWRYFNRKKLLTTTRGYALGVLREYHHYGIGSALTHAMFEMAPKAGYKACEISWILANNGPMNELSKAMGGKHNKVYRVYEKAPLN